MTVTVELHMVTVLGWAAVTLSLAIAWVDTMIQFWRVAELCENAQAAAQEAQRAAFSVASRRGGA